MPSDDRITEAATFASPDLDAGARDQLGEESGAGAFATAPTGSLRRPAPRRARGDRPGQRSPPAGSDGVPRRARGATPLAPTARHACRSRSARRRCHAGGASDRGQAPAKKLDRLAWPAGSASSRARRAAPPPACRTHRRPRTRASGQHLEEHDTERPDVRAPVDRLALAPARGSCTPRCRG